MKTEKGITLVVLIITVIVMLILTTISVQIGLQSLDSTRLQGFYTQLEIVQKRIDDISTTNESYVDSEGNIIYLKNEGRFLTNNQKIFLQNIIQSENLDVNIENFKYFTVGDLESILEISEIEYNLFIDFNSRVIIAENGIQIGNTTYYLLKNATYFVNQNTDKNIGIIQSLSYKVTPYGTSKYKIVVTPSNTVGDVGGTGYVKYKKINTKYWEVSDNTEIILEASEEYNIVFTDANKNSIEKTIIVKLDSDGTASVVEI